jgi:hypothetical protein
MKRAIERRKCFCASRDKVYIINIHTVDDFRTALSSVKDIVELHVYAHGASGLLFIGNPPGANYNLSTKGGRFGSYDSRPVSTLPKNTFKPSGATRGCPERSIHLNSCFSSLPPIFGVEWSFETLTSSFEKHFGVPTYGNFQGCLYPHDLNDPKNVYPTDAWIYWLERFLPNLPVPEDGPWFLPP